MVGIGTAFDGVEAGVEIMSRGRAHGCRLEATFEFHALGGEMVNVGRKCLSAITADVAKSAVVGKNHHEVWLIGHRRDRGRRHPQQPDSKQAKIDTARDKRHRDCASKKEARYVLFKDETSSYSCQLLFVTPKNIVNVDGAEDRSG